MLAVALAPRPGEALDRAMALRERRRVTRRGCRMEFAETLLVTGLEVLRNEVERVVAATGSQLRTVGDIRAAAPFWNSAAEVLLGSDIRELPPRGRAPAVLVGLNGDGDGLWQLAAAVGAERVAVLPEGASWLAEYLSRSRRPEPGGFVLGFVGGCGGAGASTAAVWVAHAAARRGVSVLLVDGDPRGGGLELSIDAEETPGLRWPDLADARGTIDPRQLADSLPVAGRVPVLVLAREQGPAGRGGPRRRGGGAGCCPARFRACGHGSWPVPGSAAHVCLGL
ncbi:septum site-determining protein Ssd [Pseudarthrobacter sp. So.54]